MTLLVPPAPFAPNEYIQTSMTGNRVSRKSIILGSQNIILGGKCIIHHSAVVRGDLPRAGPKATAASGTSGSTSAQTQPQAGVVVTMGRYCVLGEGSLLRPAHKIYKGVFSYYPLKLGDHVHIGAGSVIEAANIGNHVDVGKNCIVGRFVIIRDCARILEGTVLAPSTVVPSWTVWAGSPGKQIASLEETFVEQWHSATKDYYLKFKPLPAPLPTSRAGVRWQ